MSARTFGRLLTPLLVLALTAQAAAAEWILWEWQYYARDERHLLDGLRRGARLDSKQSHGISPTSRACVQDAQSKAKARVAEAQTRPNYTSPPRRWTPPIRRAWPWNSTTTRTTWTRTA
jgi:hypothetical protein